MSEKDYTRSINTDKKHDFESNTELRKQKYKGQ